MGTKTKTIQDLQTAKMFDEENGLLMKEFLRIFAQTKTIDPYNMMKSALMDSMHFFNETVFKKMGVSATTDMVFHTITDDALLAHIKKNIDPTATSIVGFGHTDNNGVPVNGWLLKLQTSNFLVVLKIRLCLVEIQHQVHINKDLTLVHQWITLQKYEML